MASSVPASASASVGHASMQRRHSPQSSSSGGARLDLDVGDERAEHDPGAVAARDQHRVLPVEADPRADGALAVDVLVRVDEHAVGAAEAPAERVEALAQLRVGVVPGVARQAALARPGRRRGRVVAERRRDDGAGIRQQRLGMAGDLRLRHREAHVGKEAPLPALADVALGLGVGRGEAPRPTASIPSSSASRSSSAVVTAEVCPLRSFARIRAEPARVAGDLALRDRERDGRIGLVRLRRVASSGLAASSASRSAAQPMGVEVFRTARRAAGARSRATRPERVVACAQIRVGWPRRTPPVSEHGFGCSLPPQPETSASEDEQRPTSVRLHDVPDYTIVR